MDNNIFIVEENGQKSMKNTWNSFHYYHHLYENTPSHTLSRGAAQLNHVHGHWKLPMLLMVFVDRFGGTIILLTLKNRTKSKYFGRFLSSPALNIEHSWTLVPHMDTLCFHGGLVDDRCLVGLWLTYQSILINTILLVVLFNASITIKREPEIGNLKEKKK